MAGAVSAAPADFPNVHTLGDAVSDEFGPFIVYSREFTAARVPVFDKFGDAMAHAKWLANSTPGFAYFIMSPCAAACAKGPGVEAAAAQRAEQASAVAQ